jgi:hypothetical protein
LPMRCGELISFSRHRSILHVTVVAIQS